MGMLNSKATLFLQSGSVFYHYFILLVGIELAGGGYLLPNGCNRAY